MSFSPVSQRYSINLEKMAKLNSSRFIQGPELSYCHLVSTRLETVKVRRDYFLVSLQYRPLHLNQQLKEWFLLWENCSEAVPFSETFRNFT